MNDRRTFFGLALGLLLIAIAVARLAGHSPVDDSTPGAVRAVLVEEPLPPGDPSTAISRRSSRSAVALAGLPPNLLERLRSMTQGEWAQVLTVHTEAAAIEADAPGVVGRYSIVGSEARFSPSYPLVAGMSYRVRFYPQRLAALGGSAAVPVAQENSALGIDEVIVVSSTTTSADAGGTHVVRIYPTAGRLPMNLLRMYVSFSAPMRRGQASDHVRVVDESTGRAVADAFVEIDTELWNAEQTRLTVLFDPGRIKRGLVPHNELGPPLRAGQSYRLEVDADFLDANREPLREGFTKSFDVIDSDYSVPSVAEWRIRPPAAGGFGAVVLELDEGLDSALMLRLLSVQTHAGDRVRGIAELGPDERSWSFRPDSPWQVGEFAISAPRVIEDLAGNNLSNPFDLDLTEHPQRLDESGALLIPFAVELEGS